MRGRQSSEEVLVRQTCGAYTTSTVRGERASSTGGPEFAARALGEKLHGARFVNAQLIKRVDTSLEHWRLIFNNV